ncbi:MAG: VOC family protein [Chloroflexi bacterium]|nr:VOC family protein [Chloroflexota bacterium]
MITKRLAHINILANDLAAAEQFYCGVLGMERGFDFIKNGSLFGFYAKAGNDTYVEVFTTEGHEVDNGRPLMKHLCFEVEDLDSAIAAIRAKGWPIGDKKLGGDNAWQAWTADPSGIPIELMQYTAQSSHFTGAPCPVTW